MKIVTRPETITPETATKYLEKNTRNRPLIQPTVDRYASMMAQGHWLLTHQGVAFSESGALLDGQHRLSAIVKCGQPVTIMVSRGLPDGQQNGINIDTMDVIDCGKTRTVGHQLGLSHGVKNANLTAAACRCIAHICTAAKFAITTPQALSILDIYGPHIASVIETVGAFKPGRKSGVIGALAFARVTHRDATDNFASQISNGENLKKGDPAFAFRAWLINSSQVAAGGSCYQHFCIEGTLNCLLNASNSEAVLQVKRGEIGKKFFAAKQRGNVEKIRARLGF